MHRSEDMSVSYAYRVAGIYDAGVPDVRYTFVQALMPQQNSGASAKEEGTGGTRRVSK